MTPQSSAVTTGAIGLGSAAGAKAVIYLATVLHLPPPDWDTACYIAVAAVAAGHAIRNVIATRWPTGAQPIAQQPPVVPGAQP